MTRMISRNVIACILVCVSNTVAFADMNDSGGKIKWSYRGNLGPARWGQIDPHFLVCAEGKTQSPINIKKKFTPAAYLLSVHYIDNPMIIMDNGNTSLTIGKTATIVNTGHSVQLDFHETKDKEYMTYAGDKYELVQFHFHSPSETLLHGASFPLEIHFVHQGENGKVAVFGVFVKAGKANPTIQKIVDHIPAEEGKEYKINGEHLNPAELLPAKKDYYSFMGSLTTPPCTEGLQWIVMPSPITASPGQIMQLRKAAGGDNVRPIQPLRHRVISYSVENKT